MRRTLWLQEARRAGLAVWSAPLIVVATATAAAVVIARPGGPHAVARGWVAVLEAGLPLAAGIPQTTLVGRDPAIELLLTMPVPYRTVLLRRAACGLAAAAATGLAATAVLWWGWSVPHGPVAGQLIWLSPTVALSGVALLGGVLLREPAAAGGVVTVVWLLAALLPARVPPLLYLFATSGEFHAGWWANRLLLLLTGIVAVALAVAAAGRSEALLNSGGAR